MLVLILLCTASIGCTQSIQTPVEQSTTFSTPLDLMFEVLNAKSHPNFWKDTSIMLNGFAEQEICKFYDVLENSATYREWVSERAQWWQTKVSDYKNEYGNDYIHSYSIDQKDTLDAEQISDIQGMINKRAQWWKRILDELENASDYTWGEIQYVSELSRENRMRILQIAEDIYHIYSNAQVTEGYQLHYTHITNGCKLDQPIKKQDSITVCLIGENWVNIDRLYGKEGYTELTYAMSLFYEPLFVLT